MFAIRQIIEDPQDFIPIPPELRHRRTEVIFIAVDQEGDDDNQRNRADITSIRRKTVAEFEAWSQRAAASALPAAVELTDEDVVYMVKESR
ncbi:MAG: hypothetical protein WCP34_15345 [Pseudomonadota bacterium]